jgi:hypothetical protein
MAGHRIGGGRLDDLPFGVHTSSKAPPAPGAHLGLHLLTVVADPQRVVRGKDAEPAARGSTQGWMHEQQSVGRRTASGAVIPTCG